MVLIVGFVVVLAVVIALALAWLPMQLLMSRMAMNVKAFIERQRDRRLSKRGSPDRRKPVT
jgi:uncharacterized membrane protein